MRFFKKFSQTSLLLSAILFLSILSFYNFSVHGESFRGTDELNSIDSKGNVTRYKKNKISIYNDNESQKFVDDYNDIIEPGFPVQTYHSSGSFHGGPAVNTLVTDLNNDNYKELIVSGLATGPLYAFDHNGDQLSGWPVNATNGGAHYTTSSGNKVQVGTWQAKLAAFNESGTMLWERNAYNYITAPGSIGELSSSQQTGFFIGEENFQVNGYSADTSSVLTGWPFGGNNGQKQHTPAVADIDGDGEVDTFPVVGDVGGDDSIEVIIISEETASPWRDIVNIYDGMGNLENSWMMPAGTPYGTAPALADLTGDQIPDIVVQLERYTVAYDGSGNMLPGWPVDAGSTHWKGNSAPAIGDVDGDMLPEVVFTTTDYYTNYTGYIHVVNHDGTYVTDFPMTMRNHENGGGHAISDIDNDGHNEIIITSDFWNGISDDYDKLWAFDLNRDDPGVTHGCIEWEQFMADDHNSRVYNPNCGECVPDPVNPADGEIITSKPFTIDWTECPDAVKHQMVLISPGASRITQPLSKSEFTVSVYNGFFEPGEEYSWKGRSCYDEYCTDTSSWSGLSHFWWMYSTEESKNPESGF